MTYSIAARCEKTGAFGIAITSSSICVASRCAWVGPLGAIATQNVTDPALGPAGLGLLRQGLGAGAVLDLLLAGTPEPEWRQIGVVDRYGKTALHSGAQALPLAALAQGSGVPRARQSARRARRSGANDRGLRADRRPRLRRTPAARAWKRGSTPAVRPATSMPPACTSPMSTIGRWSICASTGMTSRSPNCAGSGSSTRRSRRHTDRARERRARRRVSDALTSAARLRKRDRILAADRDRDFGAAVPAGAALRVR